MNKKLIIVIGRTGTGKSTLCRAVANVNHMKILKSYTTRKPRANEIDESDHIFISEQEVEQYKDIMIAYTERNGYCSFTTKDQLYENDIVILNPSGFLEIYDNILKYNLHIDLIPIYISTPLSVIKERIKTRGDSESWNANKEKENQEFTDFEINYREQVYHILNDDDITTVAIKFNNRIQKALTDTHYNLFKGDA